MLDKTNRIRKIVSIVTLFFAIIVSGCSTQKRFPPTRPDVLVEVEYSLEIRTEIWRRADGSRYLRFERPSGGMHEMEIF